MEGLCAVKSIIHGGTECCCCFVCSEGYNAWRDCIQPTDLLIKFCKENRISGPRFQPGRITVGDKVFTGKTLFVDEGKAYWTTRSGLDEDQDQGQDHSQGHYPDQ